ncbi:uncharacterized protein LOC129747097 isoform X2 [Uranotaenia lowii]|uniref:uncharacterized protein LOC129747097 isoform X2 n=1 Tax=Uranotaenia lowii TaxID=190385 RepID=UPI00247B172E|nr:uncharacterized protein LOC129747097 isoform X2 [Uranotaenia lowii]
MRTRTTTIRLRVAPEGVQLAIITLLALLLQVIELSLARLQPAENLFPTDVNNALLPNVRKSLNDCHLRYHKYGDYNLIYPIFGVPVRIGEFAHMAAIGWTQPNGEVDFNCGGSLITSRHVVTAAHCANLDQRAPDVVRLGVININVSITDPSNNRAQQFRITSIKRHPEHRFTSAYNDIALITLNSEVQINDAVTPVCLWDQSEVNFPTLEAVGFGQTSWGGSKTPVLLKVRLSPVSNDECRIHYPTERRLRQGIQDTQVCAKDSKMDTCTGDSGGPLQIKLLSNHRSTPYLVGLTSFGAYCGTDTPSVYTRISSFIPWLQNETNESFDTATCTSRYIHLRETDDSLISSRTGSNLFIEPEKSYMDIEILPKHRVYLGYRERSTNRIQWNCGGVLINEDYVLTVAHCDGFIWDQSPTHVKVGDLDIHKDHPEAQIIPIERFIKHPLHREGWMENDIALVKLARDVKINQNVLPACLVDNDLTLPAYEMAGLGPYNLNNFLRDEEPVSTNRTLVLTRMRVDETRCQGVKSSQYLCTKNEKFLVPNTCRIEHGGALEREIWHYDKFFQYVFGLAVAGKDCGFGSEAYFIRTSTHIKWIESIVLGKDAVLRRSVRQIFFPGPTSTGSAEVASEGQPCTTIQNTPVKMCQNGLNPLVCCHEPQQSTAVSRERYTVKKCVTYWRQMKRPEDDEYESIPSEGRPVQEQEHPHLALIGTILSSGSIRWSCIGVLISDRFVLAASNCMESTNRIVVRLGTSQTKSSTDSSKDLAVKQILVPPGSGSGLAIFELSSTITFSSNILPACLWPNTNSVALKLYVLGLSEDQINVRPRLAKYNQDCRKMFKPRSLVEGEHICAENYYSSDDTCQDRTGDPIEAMISSGNIKISLVVGFTMEQIGCSKTAGGRSSGDTISIYTRLTAHMDWIRAIVES